MGKPTTDYKYLGGSGRKYPTGKTYTKTVYTSPVDDSTIIEWSKDAIQYAFNNGNVNVGVTDTYIYGIANYGKSNELKFEGYKDNTSGKITTFYPVSDWTRYDRIN